MLLAQVEPSTAAIHVALPSAKAPDPCPGSMLRAKALPSGLGAAKLHPQAGAVPARHTLRRLSAVPVARGMYRAKRAQVLHVPKLSSYTSLRSHSSTCTEHWSIGALAAEHRLSS